MQQQAHNDSEQFLVLSEELLGVIMHYFTEMPKGVLDDYVSLGATIGRVVCALRKNANLKQEIVPFTIASIKWKLGQSGMG